MPRATFIVSCFPYRDRVTSMEAHPVHVLPDQVSICHRAPGDQSQPLVDAAQLFEGSARPEHGMDAPARLHCARRPPGPRC